MSNFIKAAIAVLVLAGCMTPQQKAAQMQAEMETMMVMYGPACTKLGFTANSDPWRDCVLRLDAKDDMERYGEPTYYASFGRPYWGLGTRWGGRYW